MMDNNAAAGALKKKTKGRRKIPIEKIDKKQNRNVTFTKRRKGLFKKAEELSIMCGAKISILVRSEGERLFSFGIHSVEDMISRFQSSGCDLVPAAVITDDLVPEDFTEDVDEDAVFWSELGEINSEYDQDFFWSELGEINSEYDQDLFWSELDSKNSQQQNMWFS